MNYGLQKKSVRNAIYYLCELLSRLYEPYLDINIKDLALIEKYKTYANGNNWFYKNCRNTLLQLGIITLTDKSYKHNFINHSATKVSRVLENECQKYYIDISTLRETMIAYGIDINILYQKVYNRINFSQNVIDSIDEAVENGTYSSRGLDILNLYGVNICDINLEHIKKLNSLFKRKCDKGTIFGRTLLNCDYTDAEIYYAIYKYCEELNDYVWTSNILGECWRVEGNNHHCIPTINRGKKGWVSKIGIRATNSLCNYYTYKKHPERGYIGSREHYLDSVFGKDNWEEYDVKGSIFRIERYLNTGDFLPMDEDPYAHMFSDDLFKDMARNDLKLSGLRFNFEGGLSSTVRHFKRTTLFNECRDVNGYQPMSFVNHWIESEYESRYKEFIETGFKATKKFTGMKKLTTKVFLDESIIMQNVRYKLSLMGIKTGLVYDCIYCEKGKMPNNIADVIKEEIIKYKESTSKIVSNLGGL